MLYKISNKPTIRWIVKALDFFEKKNKTYYQIINDLLWESELPFREGGEYSRFFLYYSPKNINKDLSEVEIIASVFVQ